MNWLVQRNRLKVAAIAAVTIAAAALLVRLYPDELSRYKAHLTASGEELSLAKLAPPFSADAAKAHMELSDAAAGLRFSPIPPSDVGLMNKTTNGLARAAWMLPTPSSPAKGTWDDFANQMAESEPAFAEIRRLFDTMPAGSSYAPGTLLSNKPKFDLVSRRKTAQSLAAAVVCDLNRKRLDCALSNLNALVHFASFDDQGDVLVGRMIQVSIAGLAIAAAWESLQAPGWTDAQLASLQSIWQGVENARGFARTVEMERAAGIGYYAMCRTNATQRRQMFGLGGPPGNKVATMLNENLYLPLWASAWSKGDELHYLKAMQPLVEGARQATTNNSYRLMRASFGAALGQLKTNQTAFDRFRFPVATTLMPNWEKAVIVLLRYETQRQMLLTVLALKRYELRHGQLPADLTSLVAEYLPTLPVDHMNGRHLQYRRISDQRFKLWSVGDNEQDENGDGDDLVWFELDTRPADGSSVEP